MTLNFTPINELTFASTLASADYLLIWDVSEANLAKRMTLQTLANFLSLASAQINWTDILNKPATFAPSAHIHAPADIAEFDSAVDARLANLPNGAIIGGVAHFFQSTPPTTRIDGSILQIGDRLTKPNGLDYSWNGALWLGERVSFGYLVGNFFDLFAYVDPSHGVFWESAFFVSAQVQSAAPNWDTSNFWRIEYIAYAGSAIYEPVSMRDLSGYSLGNRIYKEFSINMGFIPSNPQIGGNIAAAQIRKVGDPSNPGLFLTLNIRPILL